MDELKPCPFCGGEAAFSDVIFATSSYHPHKRTYRKIFCKKCGAETKAWGTENKAVEAWNRRAQIRHGEWIEQTPEDIKYSWTPFVCSVCSLPSGKHRTNYCPNCGAKMDGERKEE